MHMNTEEKQERGSICLSRYSSINNESGVTETIVCNFINVVTTFHVCYCDCKLHRCIHFPSFCNAITYLFKSRSLILNIDPPLLPDQTSGCTSIGG